MRKLKYKIGDTIVIVKNPEAGLLACRIAGEVTKVKSINDMGNYVTFSTWPGGN